MLKTHKILAVFSLIIFCNFHDALAQPPQAAPQVAPQIQPSTPQDSIGSYRDLQTRSDYDKFLERLKEHVENITKPEYYEKLKIVHADTKQEVKIQDMPDIQRHFIYLMNAEITTNMMSGVEKTWTAKRDAAQENRQANRTSPSKSDMDKYLAKLKELRKQHALNFENLMSNMGEKFKEDIPADEWDKYQKRVQAFHDDKNLVDRKNK